ncbi:MAG: FKBP-type peptidyl-prolyl cis-trans isomerase [Micrococcales bacterium]|nr:FKBP-type peptidyl-prolyl cis-trans isomerase [Micrococcales bacterium]
MRKLVFVVTLAAVAALTLAACSSSEPAPSAEAKTEATLPTVAFDEAGVPSIEIPADAAPPTELVAEVLSSGTGPAVEVGQSITVHYSGWLWADGTQFDSSWERGEPSTFPLIEGGLIDGWVKGLDGQSVGSQVLLVIPPEMGYGAGGGGGIPGDSTLVFVVDILAAQ